MTAAAKVPATAFVPAREGAPVTRPPAPPRRPRARRAKAPQFVHASFAAEVQSYLDRLTLAQLICLAYGHIWPVLIPGLGRPQGWSAFPDHRVERQGVFLVSEDCVRDDTGSTCGTVRTSYTSRSGIFMEKGATRQYKRDKDIWQIRPEGSRITRVDVINYIMSRMGAELFTEPVPGEGAIA